MGNGFLRLYKRFESGFLSWPWNTKEATEPTAEEVLPPKPRRKKAKGQRETDLKEFPEEILPPYSISEEELDAFYSKGNWKRIPDGTCQTGLCRCRQGDGQKRADSRQTGRCISGIEPDRIDL